MCIRDSSEDVVQVAVPPLALVLAVVSKLNLTAVALGPQVCADATDEKTPSVSASKARRNRTIRLRTWAMVELTN